MLLWLVVVIIAVVCNLRSLSILLLLFLLSYFVFSAHSSLATQSSIDATPTLPRPHSLGSAHVPSACMTPRLSVGHLEKIRWCRFGLLCSRPTQVRVSRLTLDFTLCLFISASRKASRTPPPPCGAICRILYIADTPKFGWSPATTQDERAPVPRKSLGARVTRK